MWHIPCELALELSELASTLYLNPGQVAVAHSPNLAGVQIGRYQQAGRVLDDNQPSSKLVRMIADRIIRAVEKQEGGGFQSHIPSFKWHAWPLSILYILVLSSAFYSLPSRSMPVRVSGVQATPTHSVHRSPALLTCVSLLHAFFCPSSRLQGYKDGHPLSACADNGHIV